MFNNIKEAFKNKDLRVKILLTIGLVVIFRLGCWLPNPCFVLDTFKTGVEGNQFLSLLSSISGGALANASLLALGVSPYISGQIIIQLLTVAIPSLEKLAKSGEDGKQKIDKITKFVSLFLALAQSIGIVVAYGEALNLKLFGPDEAPQWLVATVAVTILVSGSMFTYWLGEKITEYGVSNGLSLLIFVGILSSGGTSIFRIIQAATQDITYILYLVIFFVAVIAIIMGEICVYGI